MSDIHITCIKCGERKSSHCFGEKYFNSRSSQLVYVDLCDACLSALTERQMWQYMYDMPCKPSFNEQLKTKSMF